MENIYEKRKDERMKDVVTSTLSNTPHFVTLDSSA